MQWKQWRISNKIEKTVEEARKAGVPLKENPYAEDLHGYMKRYFELEEKYEMLIIHKEQRKALRFGVVSKPQGDQYYITRD